jgi:heat shock protein HslJ
MTFDSSGVVTGNTSCSEYSAVATIQGAKLSFATVSTKHQECASALADQERRFQKALFYVRSYRIDSGGSLHLMDGDDHERMRLAPASPPR